MPKNGGKPPPNLKPPLPPKRYNLRKIDFSKLRPPVHSSSKHKPGSHIGLVTPPPSRVLVDSFPDWEEASVVTAKSSPLVARVIHWRSGKYCVVQGPFPDLMFRSETRDSPEKAAKLDPFDMHGRDATTRDDQYAKVLFSDVLPIEAGENEFGTVSP